MPKNSIYIFDIVVAIIMMHIYNYVTIIMMYIFGNICYVKNRYVNVCMNIGAYM